MKIKCDTCDRILDVDGRRIFVYCLCGSEIQTRKFTSRKSKIKRTLD